MVFRTASNRIFAGLSHFYDASKDETDKRFWTLTEIEAGTGEQGKTFRVPIESRDAVAVDDSGLLYLAALNQIFKVGREPKVYRIAGTGLEGSHDGPVASAELGSVRVLQFYGDGSALMLDDDPADNDRQIIRRLLPAAQ